MCARFRRALGAWKRGVHEQLTPVVEREVEVGAVEFVSSLREPPASGYRHPVVVSPKDAPSSRIL